MKQRYLNQRPSTNLPSSKPRFRPPESCNLAARQGVSTNAFPHSYCLPALPTTTLCRCGACVFAKSCCPGPSLSKQSAGASSHALLAGPKNTSSSLSLVSETEGHHDHTAGQHFSCCWSWRFGALKAFQHECFSSAPTSITASGFRHRTQWQKHNARAHFVIFGKKNCKPKLTAHWGL